MSTGNLITTNGKLIALHRTFTASPTITAPTRFSVGTGTTTPAIGDTALATVVAINGGNYKNFVAGYPTIDETAKTATIRCLLLSTEANSNTLTEIGMFNTDGTPLMFSRAVFTAISKTTSVQIIFKEVNQIS